MNFKYFIKFIFPLSVFLLLILYLTIMPQEGITSNIKIKLSTSDTFKHILAYSFLSILFFRLYSNTSLKNKAIHLAILSAFLYGFLTESFQMFIPSRIFSFKDITANFFGSCIILIKGLFR